jgi:dipeptidase D
VEVSTSSRSFLAAQLEAAQTRIRVLGEQFGAAIEVRDGYPGWEPRADSQLLQVARAAYERAYGRAPQVEVVHAGLECGAIVSKRQGMEAVSFGPLIRGPHTPEEFVEISSVASTWQLLTELLQSLGRTQL